MRNSDGTFHVFVNGKDRGTAASLVPPDKQRQNLLYSSWSLYYCLIPTYFTDIHSQKHASFNMSIDILQQLVTTSRYQDAFAWLTTACWRQACCKLSTDLLQVDCIQTCYQQACCNMFQQVETSLRMTSCNNPDFSILVATWWNWQACCNLLTSCSKPVKLTTFWLFAKLAFLAAYERETFL